MVQENWINEQRVQTRQVVMTSQNSSAEDVIVEIARTGLI